MHVKTSTQFNISKLLRLNFANFFQTNLNLACDELSLVNCSSKLFIAGLRITLSVYPFLVEEISELGVLVLSWLICLGIVSLSARGSFCLFYEKTLWTSDEIVNYVYMFILFSSSNYFTVNYLPLWLLSEMLKHSFHP